MRELIDFLGSIDDEYLIGLSNKGIVKRSYKDLEKEKIVLNENGTECKGVLGDTEVTVILPLSNSKCTCPAHGICKHIIMTIIALKNSKPNEIIQNEKVGNEERDNNISQTSSENIEDKVEKTTSADGEITNYINKPKQKHILPSIKELKKNISDKEFIKIVDELEHNDKPEIINGSIITVKDTVTDTTVKLTFPVQYSSCSCHSDKLCRHKVKAILLVRLSEGELTMKEIIKCKEETVLSEWDTNGINEVINDICKTLTELVMTGTARMSPGIPEELERLAIRCHSVQLADMERRMRVLSDTMASYQGRKARVNVSYIMKLVSEAYAIIDRIGIKLSKGEDILELVGSFRSEYEEALELHLSGMGMRHFVSDAGYEGDTIYFLEDSGKWYTYTVARPIFYEKKKRRTGFAESPWGLPCSMQKMARAKLVLKNAKANRENRLSSTSKSSAELIGESSITEELLSDNIYDDFARLWKDYMGRLKAASRGVSGVSKDISETDKLFLVKPSRIYDMNFDEIKQQLVFYMEDKIGRTLYAKLTYSKEEADAIKSLERMKRNIEKKKEKLPVFLGIIYVEDGKCVMYPIETLQIRGDNK